MSSTNATSILQPSIPISMENLTAITAEAYSFIKSFIICISTSSAISVIASFLLIRMICVSKNRLSTTYHRLMLGLSIGDISFSMGNATYALTSPSGKQATCSAEVFIATVGLALTLCYSCSLNFYYLAKVKNNKSDTHIRTKNEPFLHGVPILIGLVLGVYGLVNENYNNAGVASCDSGSIYNPPHCIGYEDGEVREGFKIPCGRGRNLGLFTVFKVTLIITMGIIMIVSMGMIYRSVSKQEKKMSRFGVGTLNLTAQQSSSSNPNRNNSCSRAVLHRALAYFIAYFLTWSWGIATYSIFVAGKEVPLALMYMQSIFQSLQGVYNLLVFMHPNVMAAKKSQGADLSWGKAFAKTFWSSLGFGKSKNQENTQPIAAKKNDPAPIANDSSKSGNQPSRDHCNSPDTAEEEKCEIQAHGCDDLESS